MRIDDPAAAATMIADAKHLGEMEVRMKKTEMHEVCMSHLYSASVPVHLSIALVNTSQKIKIHLATVRRKLKYFSDDDRRCEAPRRDGGKDENTN